MIRSTVLLYCYFIVLTLSHDLNEEFLLCKKCGHEIAYIRHMNFKQTPFATKTWNDSTFLHNHNGHHLHSTTPPTKIQLVINGLGQYFKLITVTQANMKLLNHTTSIQDTWFPGFKWTIGLCPQCMIHIGWHFKSVNGEGSFFALVMDSLFDESKAEELVLQPKLKMF